MKPLRRSPVFRYISIVVVVGCLAGCAQTDQNRVPRRQELDQVALSLTPTKHNVRTVQLYQGADETSLPILVMGGVDRLTLEFDVLEPSGRPFSVYFYHTDRFWIRDHLQPVQYLNSFQRDEILDYSVSIGTEVPYTHYRYQFPNNDIQFRVSGNYIIRVTEIGSEEEVVFEKPLLVSEQSTEVGLTVRSVLGDLSGVLMSQPWARFRPPVEQENDIFNFNTCFIRNMRFSQALCPQHAFMSEAPLLQYYLEPYDAFEPEVDYRILDLSGLDVGTQIVSVDFNASPHEVMLDYDLAGLGTFFLDVDQFGQPSISSSVRDVTDPDILAEYVETHFRFQPPEGHGGGNAWLRGSFFDWNQGIGQPLTWNEEERLYEASLLLKQGLYEYQYITQRGEGFSRAATFNPPSMYTALVYYRDHRLATDRLVAVRSVVSR